MRCARTLASWAALAISLSGLAACDAGTGEAPNILFILTDDQRWDTLGAYGNEVVRTPSLDALARDGARLDAFYAAAPLCNPARASLLSGLYPHQHGVSGGHAEGAPPPAEDLPDGAATVAHQLARAGYVTGFVGKAHLGGDPGRWGFVDVPVFLAGGGSGHVDPELTVDGRPSRLRGHITQIFADAAIDFLRRHRDERWFLWLATTAPHAPFFGASHGYPPSSITPPPGWPKGTPLTRPRTWAGYYASITMLDEQIGRILGELDDLGLERETLVFFTSDNGFMFGSHGQAAKQVWFEESVRTPALARWPGVIAPGSVVKSPIVSVDLLPTLLEAAGLPPAADLEAVSMLDALRGRPPRRTLAFSEIQQGARFGGRHWRMVRDARFKYVRSDDGRERLFDLVADPSEKVDLAGRPAALPQLSRLRAALSDWEARTPTAAQRAAPTPSPGPEGLTPPAGGPP